MAKELAKGKETIWFPFPKLSPARNTLFARDGSNSGVLTPFPLPILGFLPPSGIRTRNASRILIERVSLE